MSFGSSLSSRIVEADAPNTLSAANSDRAVPHSPPANAVTLPGQFMLSRPESKSALTVLVAEDNFANQLITRTLLSRAGHEVTTAENGSEAIKLALSQAFDLILMDIEMPVLNGIEATEFIRKSPGPNKTCPIIALTAFGSASQKYIYRHSGIDHVLSKPFRIKHLEKLFSDDPTPLPPEPETVPGALLDMTTVMALLEAAGPKALVPVIKAFWRSAYALLADMQEAHDVWDRARLQKSAHAMKGASINIGLPAISRISAGLQNAKSEDTKVLLERLEDTMTRSRKELAKFIMATPTE